MTLIIVIKQVKVYSWFIHYNIKRRRYKHTVIIPNDILKAWFLMNAIVYTSCFTCVFVLPWKRVDTCIRISHKLIVLYNDFPELKYNIEQYHNEVNVR
jgi:hypothetical protein